MKKGIIIILLFITPFTIYCQINEKNIIKTTDSTKSITYPYFINENNSKEINYQINLYLNKMQNEFYGFLWIFDYKITQNQINCLSIKFFYKITINCISIKYQRSREITIKNNKIVTAIDFGD